MPSTEQIVNDIKAILNQIEADTSATAQQATEIHGDTTAILATEQAGFASLSQGLATVVDRLDETNGWLAINDAQNKLMICWLGIIADLECRQLHQLERQVQLQEAMSSSLAQVQAITELVHSREAVELGRESDLRAELERCCPPERPKPEPCFEPCDVDVPAPRRKKISSYEPLEPPKPRKSRARG